MNEMFSPLRRTVTRPAFLVPAAALALAVPLITVTTAGSGTAAAASEAGCATPAVAIQGHATYQKIAGFGVSEAFGAANGIWLVASPWA